jgi:hypothetical protein
MSGFNIFSDSFGDVLGKSSTGSGNNSSSDDTTETGVSYLRQNRSLWRAVILQAIIDILNNSSRTENKIAKIEAKQWVFQDNEHFSQICYLAGYTTQYVREKIMKIMRKNLASKIIINRIYAEDREEKFVFNLDFQQQNPYEQKLMQFSY